MSKEAYVYIVASRSRTLYIGMTTDLDGRILEHKQGIYEGFSKDYRCTRLVYYEICDGPIAAIAREKQLKGWRREKKIALIEKNNPTWVDLAENLGKPVQPYRWKREELVALHEALQMAQKKAGPSTSLRFAQDDEGDVHSDEIRTQGDEGDVQNNGGNTQGDEGNAQGDEVDAHSDEVRAQGDEENVQKDEGNAQDAEIR